VTSGSIAVQYDERVRAPDRPNGSIARRSAVPNRPYRISRRKRIDRRVRVPGQSRRAGTAPRRQHRLYGASRRSTGSSSTQLAPVHRTVLDEGGTQYHHGCWTSTGGYISSSARQCATTKGRSRGNGEWQNGVGVDSIRPERTVERSPERLTARVRRHRSEQIAATGSTGRLPEEAAKRTRH